MNQLCMQKQSSHRCFALDFPTRVFILLRLFVGFTDVVPTTLRLLGLGEGFGEERKGVVVLAMFD